MKAPTNIGQHSPATDDALLSEHVVKEVTGLGRTTRYRMILVGDFPSPIAIGGERVNGRSKRVAWLKSEVLAWIAEQARTSRVNWPSMQAERAKQAAAGEVVSAD